MDVFPVEQMTNEDTGKSERGRKVLPIRLAAIVCKGGCMSSKSKSPFVGPIRTTGVRAAGTEQTGVDKYLFKKPPKVQECTRASICTLQRTSS